MIYLFIIFRLFAGTDCGVTVLESKTQMILGTNIGYYVKFHNNSSYEVDAIRYRVSFLDGFDDVLKSETKDWTAGNFLKAIKSGGSTIEMRRSWIEGAAKIKIKVLRVHYTNGDDCSVN